MSSSDDPRASLEKGMIDRRLCQHRWFDWLLLGIDDLLALDILGLVSFQSLNSTEALWVGLHLSPEVVRALVQDAEGHSSTEGCRWASGLAIWQGWSQCLCRHGNEATGVVGRGGSGCWGADTGWGQQKTPKT